MINKYSSFVNFNPFGFIRLIGSKTMKKYSQANKTTKVWFCGQTVYFIPLKNIYNTKIFDLKENEGQNANEIKNFLMGVSDRFLTTNCNTGS